MEPCPTALAHTAVLSCALEFSADDTLMPSPSVSKGGQRTVPHTNHHASHLESRLLDHVMSNPGQHPLFKMLVISQFNFPSKPEFYLW